jgi:cbb3-type cytochrome oxidase cytochrome c subunit
VLHELAGHRFDLFQVAGMVVILDLLLFFLNETVQIRPRSVHARTHRLINLLSLFVQSTLNTIHSQIQIREHNILYHQRIEFLREELKRYGDLSKREEPVVYWDWYTIGF